MNNIELQIKENDKKHKRNLSDNYIIDIEKAEILEEKMTKDFLKMFKMQKIETEIQEKNEILIIKEIEPKIESIKPKLKRRVSHDTIDNNETEKKLESQILKKLEKLKK